MVIPFAFSDLLAQPFRRRVDQFVANEADNETAATQHGLFRSARQNQRRYLGHSGQGH